MVSVRTTTQLLVIHFAEVYLHNKLEVRIINRLEAVNEGQNLELYVFAD